MNNEDIYNKAMGLVMEMDVESRANFSEKLTSHIKSESINNLLSKFEEKIKAFPKMDNSEKENFFKWYENEIKKLGY